MRVRRRPVVDEYVEGDQAVVFVDGRVVALSPLATAALLAVGAASAEVGDWTAVGVVAGMLVARFGQPPPGSDPVAATRSTLESLAELGLVELE